MARYLFQRSGSHNWWVQLRSGGQRIEKSLRTNDYKTAELLALPMIAEHKARLIAAHPRIEDAWRWQHEYAPGREHVGPDGERVIATDRQLIFVGHDGAITRTEPNGGFTFTVPSLDEQRAIVRFEDQRRDRPTLAAKNSDDALFETYLRHANVTGHFEREARDVWALYKTLSGNKSLKEADRDDGRLLLRHFEEKGLKSATIRKKLGWLRSAVNLAIDEKKLKFNPFAKVVPDRNDETKKLPLSDEDMAAIRSGLVRLSASDQLLLRVLATTGMRLSEAFQITSEAAEKGHRYTIIGRKTEASKRRVPLPTSLLEHLPKVIKGPLFTGRPGDAGKRLNRFLRECGITDKAKTLHSLRHRAADRLRAESCPDQVRYALLGHEQKSVAEGYGTGFPVKVLSEWIDKVGM